MCMQVANSETSSGCPLLPLGFRSTCLAHKPEFCGWTSSENTFSATLQSLVRSCSHQILIPVLQNERFSARSRNRVPPAKQSLYPPKEFHDYSTAKCEHFWHSASLPSIYLRSQGSCEKKNTERDSRIAAPYVPRAGSTQTHLGELQGTDRTLRKWLEEGFGQLRFCDCAALLRGQ